MTEVHAHERGNYCTTSPTFSLSFIDGQGISQVPVGENEARCFAFSMSEIS